MGIKNASVYSIIILILTLVFEITTPSYAQTASDDGPTDNYISQVYLTEEQALREVFPHCDDILFNVVPLTKEEKSQLQNKLRRKIYEDFFIVYMGIKAGEVTGYAIITEEIGKFHPYTFIVSADLNGKIAGSNTIKKRIFAENEIEDERKGGMTDWEK